MQVRTLVAYAVAVLALAEAVAGGVCTVLASDAGDTAYFVIALVLGAASISLGLVVATRRPGNVVGALLVWVGVLPINVASGDIYTDAFAARPDLVPVSAVFIGLTLGTWMFLYVPPALLALVFPDGRLPDGRRWRWVAAGLVVVPISFTILAAFDPTPYEPPFADVRHVFRAGALAPVLEVVAVALLPVFLGLLIATAAAVVVRHRREADPVRRAQVKWFALGGLFVPATLLLCWASYLFFGGPDLVLLGLAATYLAIPTATAIAVRMSHGRV